MEEGEVVVGFALAAGCEPAFCFQPGVGALDRPAFVCLRVGCSEPSFPAAPDLACRGAGRDRFAGSAWLADPRLDVLLAPAVAFRDLPKRLPEILAPASATLCQPIAYS